MPRPPREGSVRLDWPAGARPPPPCHHRRVFVALRALLYSTGFISLWIWVALQARRLDPVLGLDLPAWVRPLGIVIALAGACLTAACIIGFARYGRGTPAPFDPPRRFVAEGPYRWLRNPMYLGAAAVILGAGLFVASGGIALLSAGFLLLFHVFVLLYEEPSLTLQFGDSYRDYCRTVRRWRPRRPSPPSGERADSA